MIRPETREKDSEKERETERTSHSVEFALYLINNSIMAQASYEKLQMDVK